MAEDLDSYIVARMEAERIPGLALALTDRQGTLRVTA
jgi:hypothetical protein